MQNNDEKELKKIREQLMGYVQNRSKRILRIVFAIALSLSFTPFIYGGGWAVVNLGIIGYLGSKNPDMLKSLQTLQTMNKGTKNNPVYQNEFDNHPLIKQSYARTSTILGVLIPLMIGIVFGLICRDWIFALIPFGVSLAMKMTPLLNPELWLINTVTGLAIGVMLLLFSSWFFSKIRFSPDK
jgi:hypothetical protein